MSDRYNATDRGDASGEIRRPTLPAVSANVYSRPQEQQGSTTVLRTLVEHGVRPVNTDSTNHSSSGQSSTELSIATIAQQHESERRELQELNAKFVTYLDRVQYLEYLNGQLTGGLKALKQEWGLDAGHIKASFDPKLLALRQGIDDALRDQIIQDLQQKRYEYDVLLLDQQTAIKTDGDNDENRVNALKQELDATVRDLQDLAKEFDRRMTDLTRTRSGLENLYNEVNGLKNELDNNQLERIILESELQTMKEQAAFDNAIHLAQRQDILSLAVPVLDVSAFYRTELARAISDIREDFEVLSQSQAHELEEYYRIKTEQVREEIAAENERKRLLASEGVVESMDTSALQSSLRDHRDDANALKAEQTQLQTQLDAMIDDLEKIQDENISQRQLHDNDIARLRDNIADTQGKIDSVGSGIVSMRFELSTYRNLLNVEEQHMNRVAQEEQQRPLSRSPSPFQGQLSNAASDSTIAKKMTVQKTARGPISFDTADLETDSIIILNESYTGKQQPLRNWSIQRLNDGQKEIVYQFPSTYILRPRQTVRILSKRSHYSGKLNEEILQADRVETWGQGQRMVTRLIDENNEERAVITQTFQ